MTAARRAITDIGRSPSISRPLVRHRAGQCARERLRNLAGTINQRVAAGEVQLITAGLPFRFK